MFEYTGALHIHSFFSDGSGDPKEIAGFADEVNLDYIILTDHNTLRALHEGYEGWYGNTLMMVGYEINDKHIQNHYLALGVDETISTREPAKEYVRKVKEQGGIGFLAHPHEKRSSMEEHPPYPWTEWDTDQFTGIEIWNHMSEWMEGLTEQNKFQYFIHPLKSIDKPPEETLVKWDEIAIERPIVGIGGVDAHAHKINLLGFFEVEVFPYKVLFKSVRTHILTDEKIEKGTKPEQVQAAKKILLDALGRGSCFVANYYHGDAYGFRFFAESNDGLFRMGSSMPLNGDVKLRVILPGEGARIILIKNGKKIDEVENIDALFVINSPGAYRVEVYKEDKAWIYSNHIRVGL